MPCLIAALILSTSVLGAPSIAGDGPPERMSSREGDNTIYFEWDARKRKMRGASSSRRLTADQKVELLTKLVDRTGRIVSNGALRNISEDEQFLVRGRLFHRIYRGDEMIRSLPSRLFRTVLKPGEKIAVRFGYRLKTGSYSIRTDFVSE